MSIGFLFLFGNLVIFPLWLQTQMGYTATIAGLAAAPIGILTLIVAPLLGRYLSKIDLRIITTVGFAIFGFGSFWNAGFTTQSDFFHLVMPRFIQGAGISCFFIPLYLILLSGLPKNQTASALGLATFFRILGGSFSTSLSDTLWKRREAFHHTQLTENITALNPNMLETLNKLYAFGIDRPTGLAAINNAITQQDFMLATNEYYWLSGIIFLSLIFLIWFTKPPFTSQRAD